MHLTAAEVPVRLETLDQTGQRLSELEAQLVHLDENYALVTFEEPAAKFQLHWGTPVRFGLEDGLKRYEVSGTVVERREENSADDGEEAHSIPTWELRIRIWDCSLNVQRRVPSRKRIGFPVRLHEIADDPARCDSAAMPGEPVVARCVDIGAGGMRVRTQKLANLPPRMRLEFSLPVADGERGADAVQKFCLSGRVIRALPQGRCGDNLDIAFCFEGLTVRDGMTLHNLLA